VECVCEAYKQGTEFPTINFTFNSKSNQFPLTGKDYIEMLPFNTGSGRNCQLLFREAYAFSGKAGEEVPLVKEGTNRVFWFGTSFMKAYYTYFDIQGNTITLQKSYDAPVEKKWIFNDWRIGLIVVGVLILFACLALLLSIFKKVPAFVI